MNGRELLIGHVVDAVAAAHVFDPNGRVVETDAMPGHPGLGHEPVDRAVSIDEELDRDVHISSGGEIGSGPAQLLRVEGGEALLESIDGRPMQDDDAGNDRDVLGVLAIVVCDVLQLSLLGAY